MTERFVGKSPLLAAPYGNQTLRLDYASVEARMFAHVFHEPYDGPELIRADVCRSVRWNAWSPWADAVFSRPVDLPDHFGGVALRPVVYRGTTRGSWTGREVQVSNLPRAGGTLVENLTQRHWLSK